MPIVIMGAVISLIGLLLVPVSWITGTVTLILGGFMVTASYGFQLDARNERFREYTSLFGFKRGAWLKLGDYPDLAILSGKKGTTVRSLSNRGTTLTEEVYTVVLLTATHRTRVAVKEFKDHKKAEDFAKDLASSLEKRLTQFAPKISAASRRRR